MALISEAASKGDIRQRRLFAGEHRHGFLNTTFHQPTMRRSPQALSKGTAEMRHRSPALLRDCLERQVVRAEAFIHQLHGPPLLPGCKPPARSALFYPQLAITLE